MSSMEETTELLNPPKKLVYQDVLNLVSVFKDKAITIALALPR